MTETYDGPFSLLQMFLGQHHCPAPAQFLSVIAIAIQVILVLMIVGLTSGVDFRVGQSASRESARTFLVATAERLDFF